MMENKDNVCEKEEFGAEETVAVSEKSEKASTALKKFKDVDALEKAYGSLQAEFTRRSQKLKELERKLENLTAEKSAEAESVGVEKLRKNAEARKEAEKRFDDFVSELEGASVRAPKENAEQPNQTLVTESEPIVGLEENKSEEVKVETQSFVATGTPQTSEESSSDLYERVSRNEGVRLKIIGEYLSSLKNTGAPIMKTGSGLLATPPLKAKSILEAGNMALRLFKK